MADSYSEALQRLRQKYVQQGVGGQPTPSVSSSVPSTDTNDLYAAARQNLSRRYALAQPGPEPYPLDGVSVPPTPIPTVKQTHVPTAPMQQAPESTPIPEATAGTAYRPVQPPTPVRRAPEPIYTPPKPISVPDIPEGTAGPGYNPTYQPPVIPEATAGTTYNPKALAPAMPSQSAAPQAAQGKDISYYGAGYNMENMAKAGAEQAQRMGLTPAQQAEKQAKDQADAAAAWQKRHERVLNQIAGNDANLRYVLPEAIADMEILPSDVANIAADKLPWDRIGQFKGLEEASKAGQLNPEEGKKLLLSVMEEREKSPSRQALRGFTHGVVEQASLGLAQPIASSGSAVEGAAQFAGSVVGQIPLVAAAGAAIPAAIANPIIRGAITGAELAVGQEAVGAIARPEEFDLSSSLRNIATNAAEYAAYMGVYGKLNPMVDDLVSKSPKIARVLDTIPGEIAKGAASGAVAGGAVGVGKATLDALASEGFDVRGMVKKIGEESKQELSEEVVEAIALGIVSKWTGRPVNVAGITTNQKQNAAAGIPKAAAPNQTEEPGTKVNAAPVTKAPTPAVPLSPQDQGRADLLRASFPTMPEGVAAHLARGASGTSDEEFDAIINSMADVYPRTETAQEPPAQPAPVDTNRLDLVKASFPNMSESDAVQLVRDNARVSDTEFDDVLNRMVGWAPNVQTGDQSKGEPASGTGETIPEGPQTGGPLAVQAEPVTVQPITQTSQPTVQPTAAPVPQEDATTDKVRTASYYKGAQKQKEAGDLVTAVDQWTKQNQGDTQGFQVMRALFTDGTWRPVINSTQAGATPATNWVRVDKENPDYSGTFYVIERGATEGAGRGQTATADALTQTAEPTSQAVAMLELEEVATPVSQAPATQVEVQQQYAQASATYSPLNGTPELESMITETYPVFSQQSVKEKGIGFLVSANVQGISDAAYDNKPFTRETWFQAVNKALQKEGLGKLRPRAQEIADLLWDKANALYEATKTYRASRTQTETPAQTAPTDAPTGASSVETPTTTSATSTEQTTAPQAETTTVIATAPETTTTTETQTARLPDDEAKAEFERLKALDKKTPEDWKNIGLLSHRLKGVTAKIEEKSGNFYITFSGPISPSLGRPMGAAGFRYNGQTKEWLAATSNLNTYELVREIQREMGQGEITQSILPPATTQSLKAAAPITGVQTPTQTQEKTAQPPQDVDTSKRKRLAQSLRATAKKAQERADAIRGADRQTNTARRAGMAAGALREADSLERIAKATKTVADAFENGTIPDSLKHIKSRADVEELLHGLDMAHWDAIRANAAKEGEPFKLTDLDHLTRSRLPEPTAHYSHLQDLLKWTKGAPGTKRIQDSIQRALDRALQSANENLRYSVPVNIEEVETLLDVADKRAQKDPKAGIYTKTIWDRLASPKRVRALFGGHQPDLNHYRNLLRDFAELTTGATQKSPEQIEKERIAAAERNLVGRKIDGYFPTPRGTVDRLLEAAEIEPGMSVLEPSAGKGNIADVIKETTPEASLETIEPVQDLRTILEAKGHNLVGRDFLEHTGSYDRIVMNPPFEQYQDVTHVQHAYDLLNPGGRLVAIMSEGPFFRGDKKGVAFREWLEEVGGTSEKLPEGTFKTSERPTGVATRMVVIDKPAEGKPVVATREVAQTQTSDSEAPAAAVRDDKPTGTRYAPKPGDRVEVYWLQKWMPGVAMADKKTMETGTKRYRIILDEAVNGSEEVWMESNEIRLSSKDVPPPEVRINPKNGYVEIWFHQAPDDAQVKKLQDARFMPQKKTLWRKPGNVSGTFVLAQEITGQLQPTDAVPATTSTASGTPPAQEKHPAELTRSEFIESNRGSFVREQGARTIAGVMVGPTLYPLPADSQRNGQLTRPVEEILGDVHKGIVTSRMAVYSRGQLPNALPSERNVQPVSPEVLKDYPDLQERYGKKGAHPIATGSTVTAKTERGTSIEAQYAIVDAGQLISSHDTTLKQDGRYPQELQPRDRSRMASEDQVTRIVNGLEPEFLGESPKVSEGAPIVGPDMVVESGNGRVIALKRIYEQNHKNGATYKQWLVDNAAKFGLDPNTVEDAGAPVLVRVRQTEVDRAEFARQANEQAVAAMSATEQAKADATKLDTGMMFWFNPSDSGEVIHPGNRDFVQRFLEKVIGPNERGNYLTGDGQLSQAGITRIRNAVFAKAYGDTGAIEKLAESPDNNVRAITTGMLQAAGRIAQVNDGISDGRLFDVNLSQDIAAAMSKLSALREQGMTVEEYLRPKQLAFFRDDLPDMARDILEVFDKNKRSPKKIATILAAYAEVVEAAGDPRQQTLFARAKPSQAEVWAAAIRIAEANPNGVQTSLFQGTGGSSASLGQGSTEAGQAAQGSQIQGALDQNAPAKSGGVSDSEKLTDFGAGVNPLKVLGLAKHQAPPTTPEMKAADSAIKWNDQRTFADKYGTPKEAMRTVGNAIVDQMFDRDASLRRLKTALAGNQELTADMDAYLRIQILPKLQAGYTQTHVDKMGEILEPAGKKIRDYFRYADAVETLFRAKTFGYTWNDKTLPMKESVAQAIVDQVENGPDAQMFRRIWDNEQALWNDLRQSLIDSGVMTQEAIDQMLGTYSEKDAQGNVTRQMYVPFFRDMRAKADAEGRPLDAEEPTPGVMGLASKPGNVPKAILSQHGSNRPLMDPYERRMRAIARMVGVAQRNEVYLALDKFLETFDPNGTIAPRVAPPMERVSGALQEDDPNIPGMKRDTNIMRQLEDLGFDPNDLADPNGTINFFKPTYVKQGDSLVTYFKDGKRVYRDFKKIPDVLETLTGLEPVAQNVVSKAFEWANQTYKTGATITPGFTIANLIRDTAEAYILSHNQVVPGQALWEAMKLISSKDPFVKRVVEAGLAQGGWLRPERLSRDLVRKLEDPHGSIGVRTIWDFYQNVREQPELWTRLGEASLEYKAQRGKGASDMDAFLKAMYEGGRITLNFTRAGRTARIVNKYVPFFKIPLEAGYRLGERIVEERRAVYDPRSVWFKATVPSMALALAVAFLGGDDEMYREASDAERDKYILIPIGKGLLRIPKPNGVFGVFFNLAERSMNQWMHDDPNAFHDFGRNAIQEMFPRVGNPALELAVVLTTWAQGNPISFDEGRPILTTTEQKRSPELQYDRYTSPLVKTVVGGMGGSPKVVQHLIDKFFPGYSQGVFAAESWTKKLKGDAPIRPEDVVGRFYSRPGEGKQGRSVTLFYERVDRADRLYNDLRRRIEEESGRSVDPQKLTATQVSIRNRLLGEMSAEDRQVYGQRKELGKVSDQMAAIRKQIDRISADEKLSPQQKQKEIERLTKIITERAQSALK